MFEFVEFLLIFVMMSFEGKSVFFELYLLVFGLGGWVILGLVYEFFIEVDFVFGIGCSFILMFFGMLMICY